MQKGFTLILIALAVAIGGYFLYQQQAKTTSSTQITTQPLLVDETGSQKTFTLSNFTISLPVSEIAKSEEDLYGQVKRTKLTDNECAYVEGINFLDLEKTHPQVEERGFKPTIQVIEWDTKDLKFNSKDLEQSFIKNTVGLTNLAAYQNEAQLRNIVLADKTDEIPGTNINLNSCAGGWSIPFLIKKVDTNKFNLAYFLEVTEGNGNVFSYPSRTLVINHNDSWVIIKEEQGVSPDNWLCVKDDKRLVPDEEYIKCAIDTWAKEHRNEAENQKWIQKMLDSITYRQ